MLQGADQWLRLLTKHKLPQTSIESKPLRGFWYFLSIATHFEVNFNANSFLKPSDKPRCVSDPSLTGYPECAFLIETAIFIVQG